MRPSASSAPSSSRTSTSDPGPSVEATLRGVRGELDADASGTQEGDVRVHGHARPAMAVQGEREGRVREREHVAAVHDAMAVSHARRRRHPCRRGPERRHLDRDTQRPGGKVVRHERVAGVRSGGDA
jgi:hypothetical protein